MESESIDSLIPIFKGKKRENNSLILELLLIHGLLKPWELAKKMSEKTSRDVHDIYSIIIRKKGRLEELEYKKYIMNYDGKWLLTDKGIYAILIIILLSTATESKNMKMIFFYETLNNKNAGKIINDNTIINISCYTRYIISYISTYQTSLISYIT